jgi:large subunit ribosomal protein L25
MESIELTATRRTVKKGAAKWLRRAGIVPAILYGQGIENVPLQIEALVLKRTLARAGMSQLIHLRLDGARSTQPVLVREIQRDVFTGDPIHVDFMVVSMTEKITAEVTIVLVGEPTAAETGEGILLQGANVVEIECLPGDLVPSLEVDVSDLEIGSAIYIADLHLPDSITVLSDPQEMVAQVVAELMTEELEELDEEEELMIVEEPAEVEVISERRAEEDGGQA